MGGSVLGGGGLFLGGSLFSFSADRPFLGREGALLGRARRRRPPSTVIYRFRDVLRVDALLAPTEDVLDGVGEARGPFSEPSRMGPWSTNRSSWISRIVAAPPGKLTPGCVRGATSTKSPIANLGFSSGVVLGRSLPFDRYGADAGADASSGFLSSEALLAFFGGAFLVGAPDDERRRAGFGASSAFGGERAVSAGDVPLAFSAGFSAAGGLGGDRAAGLGDSAGVGAGGGGGIAGSAGLASGASAAGAPMASRKLPSSNDDAFAAKAARTRCGSGGSDGGARTGDFFSPPLFRDVAAGSSKTTGVFGL